MSFFNKIVKSIATNNQQDKRENKFIDYGENKVDGDHDHRRNKGGDRTPAQKKGDQKKKWKLSREFMNIIKVTNTE